MSRKLGLLLALAPLTIAAGDAPPPPSVATAPCHGVDAARVNASVRTLFADRPETRGVLLLVDGCRAVKAYAPGWSDANRFISWSMAKTITAFAIGALVKDGKLRLDAPVPFAEWHDPGDARARITLRNMLQMASGVRNSETGTDAAPEKSDRNQIEFVTGTGHMAADSLREPLEVAPGSRFEYNTLTAILLAELTTRQLTPSHDPQVRARLYRDFLDRRIFSPAGVTTAFPEFDGAGTQIGGSLIHMSLDDWGRMGSVLLDGRGSGGQQIVDPAWLAFMKTPSPREAQYGGQTWLNHPATHGENAMFPGKGPDTTAAMNGHLGQLVIAAQGIGRDGKPHRLVLVRLGNTPDSANPALMQTLGDIVETVLPHRLNAGH